MMNSFLEQPSINQPANHKVISYGKILVDTDSCIVTYEDKIITLHPKEYKLLLLFLQYPNHVLSYEVIIDKIWEIDKTPTQSSIRSHIKGLRKAFKEIDDCINIIETVHGLGYRLKPLKTEESFASSIFPSFSVMKSFFHAKAVEYIVLNNQLIIKYVSPGLVDYSDYPENLKVGIKAELAFPEFVGLEQMFQKVMNQEENTHFEVKGIARNANLNRPEYINLYIIGDALLNQQKTTKENLLFVFFEDASENMIYKQKLVQRENEFYLSLEVASHNN